MEIICNSSTIIALQTINRLDLLKKIFKEVIIPVEVAEEINFNENEKNNFIHQKEIKNRLAFSLLNESLGKGESACIILYKELSADLLILDDLKARKIAQNQDMKLTGLLGILLMAKKLQIIPSITDIIAELKNTNFRISQKLIDIVLHKVNE